MPKTRPTEAERWLTAGHRYDDVARWRELCELLEARGLIPTPELPAHLARLVFRDPENTYLAWLREEMLVPVIHRHGHAKQDGNGWLVRRDWRERLAVMSDPTPEALLGWWRTLEQTLRTTRLKRLENVYMPVYDRSVPDTHARNAWATMWHCTLCQGGSRDDDPRGILHVWREQDGEGECPLLHLHCKIRDHVRETALHPAPRRESALAEELQHLAAHYVEIGHGYEAKFWQALLDHSSWDSADNSGLRRPGWAAYHIAQLCGVWIAPTPDDIRAYARYLRTCGHWPYGAGVKGYQALVDDMYASAASQLETLLFQVC